MIAERKTCVRCQQVKNITDFVKTPSPAFMDKHIDVCNSCVERHLERAGYNWDLVDKYCMYADLPFEPKKWEQYQQTADQGEVWATYCEFYFQQKEVYGDFSWKDWYEEYCELKEKGQMNQVVPLLAENELVELRRKWGANYDENALFYLESLYKGLLMTQNINGALSTDQAYKLCKLSFLIDENIRNGLDVDKPLASYEKLVKVGNFTPKNAKEAGEFESVGELVKWLEKKNWKNDFYDGATRDVIDETIKNIQAYNRNLYINESGIGEEITSRLEALKMANEVEDRYNLSSLSNADAENYWENEYDPEQVDFVVEDGEENIV